MAAQPRTGNKNSQVCRPDRDPAEYHPHPINVLEMIGAVTSVASGKRALANVLEQEARILSRIAADVQATGKDLVPEKRAELDVFLNVILGNAERIARMRAWLTAK